MCRVAEVRPDAAEFAMRPKPIWAWTFAPLTVLSLAGAAVSRDFGLLLFALLVGAVAWSASVTRLTLSGNTVRLVRPPLRSREVHVVDGGGISLDISRPMPWFAARIFVLGAQRGRGHEKVLLLSPWFWSDWRELIRYWEARP